MDQKKTELNGRDRLEKSLMNSAPAFYASCQRWQIEDGDSLWEDTTDKHILS